MKINFKTWFVVVLTLIVTACSTQVRPTPVPIIPATPKSVVSMDGRLLASIDIRQHPLSNPTMAGDYPDEIVFANGFIWTHIISGYAVQVDPVTNAIVGDVETDIDNDPSSYCQGLGTDRKDIWVCSAGGEGDNKTIDVVRVDTSTQSIVATFKVGKIFDQFVMPYALGQIWVLSGNGDKLIGIDVKSNQPNPAIDLGVRCFQLAAWDNAIYAACGVDNLVIKIDPEKKEVVARQTLENYPKFISATKNGIWVSQGYAITRLDPETLNPAVTFSGINESGVCATETAVWVWDYKATVLYKIDPVTNEIVELLKPNKPFSSGGEVLATSDSIWLTANNDHLLLRLGLK